ncbi:MAG: D-alanine-D-alanine ligase [Thermoanaerobaculia bacterium]|jgi:D-alanine-D-alanine ligase|nr:D-alanine-D-alanine ligase [Thermoanaerobaculia bacterium]
MKVAILFGQFEGYEEQPGAEIEAAKPKRKRKKKKTDVEAIADSLRELGHETTTFPIDGRPQTLARLARSDADLFFNLIESYNGDDTMEMHFAAYLDLIGKRYTGSGPQGSYLAMDKSIAKTIVRYHGLFTPYSAVMDKGRVEHAQDIQFPVIVKPAAEDASKGIDAGSVVSSIKDLFERIAYIHDEFDSPALIEEYIEGREIYAAVIGDPPEALPLVELDLSKLPEGTPKIASHDVKFDESAEVYKKTKSAVARDLDDDVVAEIQRVAVTAVRALKLRDYARIDLRLGANGRIYLIEANPNPWLDPIAEFAMAAKESGLSYTEMVDGIVKAAMARKK